MKGDRAKLYHELIKRVARELDEKPDAEIVRHVASLRLLRESLQVRLLDGQHVDPDDLLKVDAALKQYLPQGKPMSVEVTFVEGVRGVYFCRFCGKENHLKPGEYTSIKDNSKPPPTIEGKAEEVEHAAKSPDDNAKVIASDTPVSEKASRQLPPPAPTDGNAAPSTAAAAKLDIALAKNTPDAPKPVEKRNTKWVGEGDRAFMPAVNFVEAVEGWTRPSVWPSRGGLRANQPLPPPSQACQNKKHR